MSTLGREGKRHYEERGKDIRKGGTGTTGTAHLARMSRQKLEDLDNECRYGTVMV